MPGRERNRKRRAVTVSIFFVEVCPIDDVVGAETNEGFPASHRPVSISHEDCNQETRDRRITQLAKLSINHSIGRTRS